ncbi:hypothetical protein CONLIGDRAFT_448575 [Coniochaeta ligniaria NRRL 30616]|uniref:Uncharacterized protein n=1 Tax=Coniochaeta ligniaria NRRL 30616 TaxID=1408157 RepID=A0A1J7JEQ2_9PEZI|nr:hypothetical protein CONLIGDRAFT_448575 [Coniochaeta ligniaria NRRL 30616]
MLARRPSHCPGNTSPRRPQHWWWSHLESIARGTFLSLCPLNQHLAAMWAPQHVLRSFCTGSPVVMLAKKAHILGTRESGFSSCSEQSPLWK